jgi:hypothetical protein
MLIIYLLLIFTTFSQENSLSLSLSSLSGRKKATTPTGFFPPFSSIGKILASDSAQPHLHIILASLHTFSAR